MSTILRYVLYPVRFDDEVSATLQQRLSSLTATEKDRKVAWHVSCFVALDWYLRQLPYGTALVQAYAVPLDYYHVALLLLTC